MQRIAADIYQSFVPSQTLPPYQGTQCYWIVSEGQALLVDTGDGTEPGLSVLEQDWRTLGRPVVEAVYATHYHSDHTGGGVWAKNFFHCPLYLHPRDRALLNTSQDDWLCYDASSVLVGRIEVQVVMAPGHTPGQCNFWIPSNKTLLAGDNVLGNSTVVVAPPDGHLGTYLETIGKLKSYAADLIGPGHGDIIKSPNAYLDHYLRHRLERSDEIVTLLARRALTVEELAETIYKDTLSPDKMVIGQWMMRGHLQLLVEQGIITEEKNRFIVVEGDGQ